MADDMGTQVREYVSRCLRGDELLVAFERVTIANASGAPPLIPGSPFGWLGLTKARLVVYYEGSRSVRSDRLESLARLELKSGMLKRELIWEGALAFDGSAATVSKEFAKAAAPLVADRSQWQPVREETTTCAVRVEPIEDPNLLALAKEMGFRTEHAAAYCMTCGGLCGEVKDGAVDVAECPACLRQITGIVESS